MLSWAEIELNHFLKWGNQRSKLKSNFLNLNQIDVIYIYIYIFNLVMFLVQGVCIMYIIGLRQWQTVRGQSSPSLLCSHHYTVKEVFVLCTSCKKGFTDTVFGRKVVTLCYRSHIIVKGHVIPDNGDFQWFWCYVVLHGVCWSC